MKITIDGVEYIAMPAGKNFLRDGAREIARRYNECPTFFDTILKKGFSYYERDRDYDYSIWATDDGVVFMAHDTALMDEWDEERRVFHEYHYPDIRGWNLQEFTDHLKPSGCLCQFNPANATALLLEHGPARAIAEISSCGNLEHESIIEHKVVLK